MRTHHTYEEIAGLKARGSSDELLSLLTKRAETGLCRWHIWVMMALGELHERRAIPALVEIARDERGGRSAAVHALRVLTGEDVGEDGRAWASWWADQASQSKDADEEHSASQSNGDRMGDVRDHDREITELLRGVRTGDRAAEDKLISILYNDLRRTAHNARVGLGIPTGASPGTTSLVHEAYLRISGRPAVQPNDRVHFMRLAARAMRQFIVDEIRHRTSQKAGEGAPHVPLDGATVSYDVRPLEVLALNDALEKLVADGVKDGPRLAQVVECRYFAGYSIEETAQILGVGSATVKRDWSRAKDLLKSHLL